MTDDIFDEDGDDLNLMSKEYDKLNENINKDGLRDGLSEGRQNGLQSGFNDGYADIFPVIESINFLKGLIQAIYIAPGEIKTGNYGDEANSTLGSLLTELKAVETNALEQLGESRKLQQATINSFNRIKINLIEILESMDLHPDQDALSNCTLETTNCAYSNQGIEKLI